MNIFTKLILKKDIDEDKMKALLDFLKSCGIEADVKTSIPITDRKPQEFSLATGLWKDYQLNGSELRKQVWQRNK